MKSSCPAVLVLVVKVQFDTRLDEIGVRYTVDPDVETKVQSIAVIRPSLLIPVPCESVDHCLKEMEYAHACGLK